MNVVYIGLDNPISVSVPGYSPAELQVSINPSSAGTWKQDKQAGTYLFKPNSSAKEVVVVASVTKNGKTSKMGEQRYRIKQVPKPIPMLGSIEASGSYAAGVIKSSTFVYAALKDFAFEGISYKPVKFTLIYQPKKGDGDFAQVNGQGMDTKAKQLLNKAKSGDRFTLTQVFATGPAGTVILPTALAIEVK
jgi:hypothetical protein